jgi:peptidoglycan hydrolase-like amidase
MRRMGSREPDPNGEIIEIKDVDLAEYVTDVLAHEFGDFPEDGLEHVFTGEPLMAGAVAVLMYSWYHARHPTNVNYDLDNSTRAQVYLPGKAEEKHRRAVRAVWGTIMVKEHTNAVFAPQHGQGWYNERGRGTNWMNQRGALYLSDKHRYTWDQILRYYYPNIELLRHPFSCAGLN